ncbi:N-acetylglucosamine kinase [Saprospira sp. CCB-QB6]|uniref:N-acetylglucosamine kinase n=1 Tax=Saprospira sp. CCB-QB6 TaxID=3023936 RepID=UPI00234AA1E9|nr:N-acetylglucosamine kinase [Saprospira sp. CCB-QB6]WCL81403.1 N-acetylglucosamine kinase [Saprospira sp. CCB-QB6]
MHLIADSGSTKTDWYFLASNGRYQLFQAAGMNPVTYSHLELKKAIQEVLEQFSCASIQQISFYGAGCAAEEAADKMQQLLAEAFPKCSNIEVKSDLWATIRAFGKPVQPGFYCILGTGSNACFFDGERLVQLRPSLGYLLGDEGSANALGRQLIKDYLYKVMPSSLAQAFAQQFPIVQAPNFIAQLYAQERPNAFLGQFSRFLSQNRQTNYIEKALKYHFSDFICQQLLIFEAAKNYPIHFTGSIAAVFEPELQAALSAAQLQRAKILASPLPKLLHYHLT